MPATFNECPDQNERAEALAYVRTLMEQARKESKHEDLPKLEKLIALIDSKRYGLVWEEHVELVEEEMKSKIPVFVEDETRKIKENPASEDYNFLLEGDNLHSLHWIQEDWLRKEFGKYGNCHYEEIIEFKGQDFKDAVDQKLKSGEYVLLPKSNGLNIVGKLRRLDQDSSKFYSIIKHLNKEGVKEVRGAGIEFSYPKPISLVKDLVKGATFFSKKGIILDFFAGSGTTGHAVAQLNKEDGGNRKYILCTNNENNICEEVTYQRLSNIQEDLPHNLKYFKTQFIEKDDEDLEYALLNNVKTLIELEHAINLEESDKAVAFTLSEIRELDLTGIRTVYVRQHSHALMGKEDRVRYEGIELVDVPEYYFAKEMKEAGL